MRSGVSCRHRRDPRASRGLVDRESGNRPCNGGTGRQARRDGATSRPPGLRILCTQYLYRVRTTYCGVDGWDCLDVGMWIAVARTCVAERHRGVDEKAIGPLRLKLMVFVIGQGSLGLRTPSAASSASTLDACRRRVDAQTVGIWRLGSSWFSLGPPPWCVPGFGSAADLDVTCA